MVKTGSHFLKQTSLLKTEVTSVSRVRTFNWENLHNFFDLLVKLEIHYKFTVNSTDIDQSGFENITSSERGVIIIMVHAISAADIYIPAMIIFRQNKSPYC